MSTSVDALAVRAERLPDGTDLLDGYDPDDGFFFERRGSGVSARGIARTIMVPAGAGQVERAAAMARDALDGMATGDRSGPGPMVVGALPFDGLTPATLVVPRVAVLRQRRKGTWRVVVGSADGLDRSPGMEAKATRRSTDGARLAVSAVPEPGAYVAAVAEARRRILRGDLEKVVLARMLVVRADHDVDRGALLARLRLAEPDAFVYAVHGFVGASPEQLVARSRTTVTANPLAGTAARSTDPDEDRAAADALLRSEKDLREHAPVVDAVRAGLDPVCTSLEADAEPAVVPTGKVWHLSTQLRGVLREPAPTALDLAARLHPTPAVCGTPRLEAMALIGELEAIDRTLYAGAVGWMDGNGDGEWAVGLRCAEVQGRIALLFAGAGIVAESDPASELAETDAKFRSMLDALGYA